MGYFLSRLAEPSSWAGIAALAAGIEHTVNTGGWQAAVPMILGGLAAFFAPEKGNTSPKQ